MPNTAETQISRRDAIRKLLCDGPAANQQQLVEALGRQGFVATQSSVSRDLREIGAVKTGLGYELSQPDNDGDAGVASVHDLLRKLTPAGPHLLVIKTAIGAAQRVALALDRSGWNDIVGTVAGDDTVFAATAGAQDQRRLIARMGGSATSA